MTAARSKLPPPRAPVEWRRRTGGKSGAVNQIVHGFVNGVGLCGPSRIEPGTPSMYQGAPVRAFEPAPLGPDGTPYGHTCGFCASAARRQRSGA